MKKISLTIIILILILLTYTSLSSVIAFANTNTVTESNNDVKIYAQAGVVMDAKNGNLLYEKNGTKRFYPASCTKLLTALVALENCKDLSKTITVSHEAVYGIDPESSHIALEEGEQLTMEQALYGLLLASANDAAVAIAEDVGGSIEGFATMMNAKAKELGLENSHFMNPHGLYNSQHYTCAKDLAKIMNADLDNPKFVKIFSTLKYTIPKTNKEKKRILYNNHRMIKYKYAYHPAVVGGKSGYITKSGFNLVTYGEKNNMDLIVVAMKGITATDMCTDTAKLLNHYLDNYQTISVNPTTKDINLSCKRNVPVKTSGAFDIIIPKTANIDDVSFEEIPNTGLSLPITKETIIGKINAICNHKIVGTTELYNTEAQINLASKLIRIVLTILIFIVIIVTLITFKTIKKKRGKSRYNSKN